MDYSKIKINKNLKIIFMGTPEFAVPVLEGLIENYKVRAVVTKADMESPIKQLANEKVILTLQPKNLEEEKDLILSLEPDLIITCAYGLKLPKVILDAPRLGCINVHASLLPKLRGGAPIHWAIINGYTKTGVTIMYMNEGMDTGDVISQTEIEIMETDTTSILHDKLSVIGRDLLLETLPSILNETAPRTKQDKREVTYAFNIKPKDEKIHFNKSKREIYNQIRGLNSWPGAYCYFEGKRLKVWESYISDRYFSHKFDGEITGLYDDGFGVKVNNGEIVFTVVQLEGKNKMSALDFLNGLKDKSNLIGKILD